MGRLWIYVFCILLVSPATVLPHASLVKSVPARRAQIFKAPAQIQLWFNERLEAGFSSLRVINSSGKRVDLGHANELPRCDNCGRYLYLPEDETTELSNPKPVPRAPANPPSRKTTRHVF